MSEKLSNALPSYAYGDPAVIVENKQLKDLGCKACSNHLVTFGRVFCTEPRNTNQKHVPFVGSKCKFFELKG